MSKRLKEIDDLMLHQFMEVNGFLTAFNPEVQEPRQKDEQIAAQMGRDEKTSQSELFLQLDEFLRMDPYPFDIVTGYTNLYMRTPEKSKQWLQRMADICRKAYEEE